MLSMLKAQSLFNSYLRNSGHEFLCSKQTRRQSQKIKETIQGAKGEGGQGEGKGAIYKGDYNNRKTNAIKARITNGIM